MRRLRRQHRRAQTESKRDRNRMLGFIEGPPRRQRPGPLPDHPRPVVRAVRVRPERGPAGQALHRGFAAAAVYANCRTSGWPGRSTRSPARHRPPRTSYVSPTTRLNRELGLPDGPHRPRRVPAAVRQRPRRPHDVERLAGDLVERAHDEGVVAGQKPGRRRRRAVCTPPPGNWDRTSRRSMRPMPRTSARLRFGRRIRPCRTARDPRRFSSFVRADDRSLSRVRPIQANGRLRIDVGRR